MSRRVVTGGLWNASSLVLPIAATTLLSVVTARVLGPDELGRQSLIAFAEAALAALVVSSATEATIRTLAALRGSGDAEAEARVRRWSIAAHVLSGSVVGVALAVIGLTQPTTRLSWFLAAACVQFNALGWAFAGQIVAEQGWRPVATRRLVALLVGPLLGTVAVLCGLGIAGIFFGNVLGAAGLLWSLNRARSRLSVGEWGPFPRQLATLWLGFGALEVLTQVVARRAEFVFLAAYSTPTEIAMYSIPFMLVTSLALIPIGVSGASMPVIAAAAGSGDMDRAVDRFGWGLRIAALVSLPLTGLLVGLGPQVVRVVYGPDYERAAVLVPFAALVVIASPAGAMCTSYWLGIGLLRPVISAGVAGGAVDLALAFGLIPPFGAAGAVVANLAGQLVMAGILIVVTIRHLGQVDLRLSQWSVAAVAALFLAAASYGTGHLYHGALGLALAALAGLAAFLLVAVPIGLLRADDADRLTSALPTFVGPAVRLVRCR